MRKPIALLLVAALVAGCAAQPAPTSPPDENGSAVEHGPQEGRNQAAGLVVFGIAFVAFFTVLSVAMFPGP